MAESLPSDQKELQTLSPSPDIHTQPAVTSPTDLTRREFVVDQTITAIKKTAAGAIFLKILGQATELLAAGKTDPASEKQKKNYPACL